MNNRNLLATCEVVSAVGCLILLAGCSGSSRTVNLGSKEITTQTPIQLSHNSVSQVLPIAASPDGTRIAMITSIGPDEGHIDVIDVDTQQNLGKLDINGEGEGTPMFSLDGTILYLGTGEGYVAWNYATGERRKVTDKPPRAGVGIFDASGWNYDRTIAIAIPTEGRDSRKQLMPGQVAVVGGFTQEIAFGQQSGFDQYGNAWFGKGTEWTKVDRSGQATKVQTYPKYLARDQSMDRGSMHLRATQTDMRYKDGHAAVTCIWLTDDKATPYSEWVRGKLVKVSQPYQAAVVFAGPDVFRYGFLPGRNLVYVVSNFGCYLVPFTVEAPGKKS